MADFGKIAYYDLKLEFLKGRLPKAVGRDEEISRISRIINRRKNNNCLISGPSGLGKSRLVYGWAQKVIADDTAKLPIILAEAESFNVFSQSGSVPLSKYEDALNTLPECVLILDNFGRLVYNKPAALNYVIQLLRPLAGGGKVRLFLVMESRELKWLQSEQPNFLNFFETLQLKAQGAKEQYEILQNSMADFGEKKPAVSQNIFELIIQLVERFPTLGQLPAASVGILDEALALASAHNASEITEEDIYQVTSDKTSIPLMQLKISDKEMLKNLDRELNLRIVGQSRALKQVSSTIQRAKLGLKNPNRPLGSFLMLGPSGVGKTETAKLVAEKVFGKKESFIRIDMSEFSEAHNVARLIGSPAGYVGFDSGGGLTNAVKNEPYSLILLDEIEKAHPKIFDIFLQILDDGRLTSGQGETIDFTQTIIMATSNLGVPEIIEGFLKRDDIHDESFFQKKLLPPLSQSFRMEFLNRFDSALVFKPLTADDLLAIAMLEIKKVEQRVAKHNIKFKIDPAVLIQKISTLSDPRFGARPVKRFIETTCENLISQKLLST